LFLGKRSISNTMHKRFTALDVITTAQASSLIK
jgi:hypothetical protein